MSTTPKRYRLRKDVTHPSCEYKKGDIGEQDEIGGNYYFDNYRYSFQEETVENNPEWFELITEPIEQISKDELYTRVLKTFRHNKFMIEKRDDGIYARMAGRENSGEVFSLDWYKVYSFETPTEEFKWNEELVSEFGRWLCKNATPLENSDGTWQISDTKFRSTEQMMDDFKQSNQSHIPKDFSLEERKVFTSDMGLEVLSPHPIVGAVHTKEAPPPKEYVCGVNIEWEIRSHPNDLSKVMKVEDCRFIGTNEECMQFIDKYMPPPKERIEVAVSGASWQSNKAGMLLVDLNESYIAEEKFPEIKAAIEKVINQ